MKINQAGRWERICRSVYQKVDLHFEAKNAQKHCKRQLATINGGLRGDKREFEEKVLSFWSRYGIKPKKMWYDLYCYKTKEYDPRYIPEDIYWKIIYPAMNRPAFRRVYTDKCFYSQLFPYLKQPRTIIKCSNNIFYDGNGNIISFIQAKYLLESVNQFVLKPAIYSGEGTDIFFYDREKHCKIDIEGLLKLYRTDYIVQEIVPQHEILAAIHPNSVNTIRVISFLFRGEVHISSSILRMGVGDSRLDNVSAGGIACPINPDGRLAQKGLNKNSEWMDRHPGGTVFGNVIVPSYNKILEAVCKAHKNIPHFRILGWDFSVDVNGDPVLIEYNGAPSLNQISCGPLFGDLTEQVLDEILLNKTNYSAVVEYNITTENLKEEVS